MSAGFRSPLWWLGIGAPLATPVPIVTGVRAPIAGVFGLRFAVATIGSNYAMRRSLATIGSNYAMRRSLATIGSNYAMRRPKAPAGGVIGATTAPPLVGVVISHGVLWQQDDTTIVGVD